MSASGSHHFFDDLKAVAHSAGHDARETVSLPEECERAAATLRSFVANPTDPYSVQQSIPKAVLANAKGLAIFRVIKAGFIWSGKVGDGVVVARLRDGSWSAPSCLATGGVGFGLQIGADISEYVIVMNTEEGVRSFAQMGNLTIGGTFSASAGPVGTGASVQAALSNATPLYTYCKSQGLYAGAALDGAGLAERRRANQRFYGQDVTARQILNGSVPPPQAAAGIYDILAEAMRVDETVVPAQSFVPGAAAPAPAPSYRTDEAPPRTGYYAGYTRHEGYLPSHPQYVQEGGRLSPQVQQRSSTEDQYRPPSQQAYRASWEPAERAYHPSQPAGHQERDPPLPARPEEDERRAERYEHAPPLPRQYCPAAQACRGAPEEQLPRAPSYQTCDPSSARAEPLRPVYQLYQPSAPPTNPAGTPAYQTYDGERAAQDQRPYYRESYQPPAARTRQGYGQASLGSPGYQTPPAAAPPRRE